MQFSYQCVRCKKEYSISPDLYTCPECLKLQTPDQPLLGVLEVKLKGNWELGKDPFSDLLPVDKKYFPPVPWGNTALWKPSRLRKEFDLPFLYIKDDSFNPTGSFKDRASAMVSAFALKHNINTIVLASTGNAGSSMSGIGAAAGQKIVLFLPENAPTAKLVQSLQYGATVYRVKGNYDRAYDLSLEYSSHKGGMNRSTAWNPMTMEGKKTVSFEIFSDLRFKVPDRVVVSVGDGCILGGVYKGFQDLIKLGVCKSMPKITAVQAEGSSALYRAWKTGSFDNRRSSTIADSISVDIPRNGWTALKYLNKYSGEVVTVTDNEIIEAQSELSGKSGLFTEPAGAASWAGLKKNRSNIDSDEIVVVLATGSGLKDTAAALKGIKIPSELITSLSDIKF
jgi:threonine synthase